jgi:hypothetical protein
MNIDSIPAKAFVRGSVVSIIDKEKPVIETFTDGDGVVTVAFLHGIPIPFNTFMTYMAIRFAPKRSEAMLPGHFRGGKFWPPENEIEVINRVWNKVDMPSEMRELIARQDTADTIFGIVQQLYAAVLAPDGEEEMAAAFKTFIRRIDEDYTSSLIDPIEI